MMRIKKLLSIIGIIACIIFSLEQPLIAATLVDYNVKTLTTTTQVSPGGVLRSFDTICQNEIAAPGGPKYARLYWSEDAVVSLDDIPLATHRVDVDPNMCSTGMYWSAIPSTTLGLKYLYSIVDYRNSVIEADEFNNVSPIQVIEIVNGLADITAEITASPEQVLPDQSITLSVDLCNFGPKPTGIFQANIYLSTNSTIDKSDKNIGSKQVSIYNDDCTGSSFIISGQMPSDLLVGENYFFGLIADPDDDVVESNEDNNITVGVPVSVGSPADDLVFSLFEGPSVGMTGASVTIDAMLCNGSSGRLPYLYHTVYLSPVDATIPEDIYIGWLYNAPVNMSCTTDFISSVRIPDSLAPGLYNLKVKVDIFNWVQESDETNNALTGNVIAIQ